MRTGGCYALSQFNMPYALCFFENDFCLNLLRTWLKNYLTNCAWIYVDRQEDYLSFAPFHVSMISLFANCFAASRKKEKKRKRKKKNEDTPLDVESA